MPEPRDPRSIIEAAEQAAAADNYAAAEELLREAALLQESSLGLLHPDLANTLNNLGVVCERTDNPVDAEDCFRRAFAIATAVLPQDHPFVATSRKNLRDFCEARGIPVDVASSPPAVTATLEEACNGFARATARIAVACRIARRGARAEQILQTTRDWHLDRWRDADRDSLCGPLVAQFE